MEDKLGSLKNEFDLFVSEINEFGTADLRRLGLEGPETVPTKINIALSIRLGHRLRELTSEITASRGQWKASSDEMAKYTAALVYWTKALVVVTAAYVIISGGLFWLAWTN